jgi:xanthine permease
MSEQTVKGVERTHPVDEVLPPGRLAIYRLQHVLAFYAGAVLMPLLIATGIGLPQEQVVYLVSANLFMCGIASIIQAAGFWTIGIRMPIVQGVSTTAVGPAIAIGLAAGGGSKGVSAIFGAVIVSGLITFLIAPFFSRLVRFFPPVVTGSIITVVGIYLVPIAAMQAGGGDPEAQSFGSLQNLALAFGTLGFIAATYWLFRGFINTIAILLGLVVGTAVAAILGFADLSKIGEAGWIGVTTPLHFGWPTFGPAAILSLTVVMLIVAVESTGQYFAVGDTVEKEVDQEDIAKGIRADGLATAIGGLLNSFPTTVYSQNVGLVRLSNVKSRWVIVAAGAIMILLGLLPKVGAVVATIPPSVLGGRWSSSPPSRL